MNKQEFLKKRGGYITKSRKAVLVALEQMKGWNTHLDVRDYGKEYIDAPSGNTIYDWTVWDFPDRVSRALETLYWKGIINRQNLTNEKDRLVWVYKAI